MEITVKIEAYTIFLSEQTDLSNCKICELPIYSDMYRLWMPTKVNGIRSRIYPTNLCICKSCNEMLNFKE